MGHGRMYLSIKRLLKRSRNRTSYKFIDEYRFDVRERMKISSLFFAVAAGDSR